MQGSLHRTLCFSSLHELGQVLRSRTVAFSFVAKPDPEDENCHGIVIQSAHRYQYEIGIKASGFDEKRFPTNAKILDWQKHILVHELVHFYNIALGNLTFEEYRQCDDWSHGWVEMETEEQTASLLYEQPDIMDALVAMLSRQHNQLFDYEVKDTPFFWYHREVVGELVKDLCSGRLEFGDPSQLRVLQYARTMDSFAEKCGME